MAVEEIKNKEVTPAPGSEEPKPEEKANIIETINEMKRNMVSKEEYDKVVTERDEAYKAMLEGRELDIPGQNNDSYEENEKRIKALKEDLYGNKIEDSSMTNLEFIQKTLELRDLEIEQGRDDPFLANYRKGVNATDEDYEHAERIANILKEMVDDCEGSPEAFRTIYQARVKDPFQLKVTGAPKARRN